MTGAAPVEIVARGLGVQDELRSVQAADGAV